MRNRNIILLAVLMLVLTGCKPWFGWSWFGWFDSADSTSVDFFTDNDAVFDLFEDGEGTDADDDDSPALFDGPDDTAVANDAGQPVSSTVDPAYDEIGSMTPDELRAAGTVKIPMLLLGGNEFPFPAKQFGSLVEPDKCDHLHYHGASGFTIDMKDIPEPSNPCGFDNKVTERTVTGQQMVDWFHNRPRNF